VSSRGPQGSLPAASESTGSLVPYGALSFMYFATIGLFNPYAPLWFQSLGFSTLAIGAIAALQSWTRVVMPYGWSWVGDHWGHGTRRVELLRIATALILLFSLGLLVFTDVLWVAAIVTLIFMANGAVIPLTEAVVAQRLATGRGMDVGRYGRVRVWGSIGFIIAVTLFGVLLQSTGIAALPGWLVLAFALLAAAAWRLPLQARGGPPAVSASTPTRVGQVLRRPEVAWFFAGIFFTVLAHTSLYVFLSLYLDALGFGKMAVGALWAVSVAAEIGFFWTQGHWFARWSAHAWLLAAALVSVLRFGAMAALGGAWWLLVLAQCLHALTFAAQHAACISLVDRYFAGPMRGRGQALYSTLGYGLSGVIGGVAGGAISQRWGFESVFGAAALVSVAATFCCWRSQRLAAPTAPTIAA
jgi:PPP family 3-phenylpropionic acid transporter